MTAVEGISGAGRPEHADDIPLSAVLVMASLGAASIGQGAYHRSGQVLTGLLLVTAALAAMWNRQLPVLALRSLPFALAAALAAWTVVSAVASGDPTSAAPAVLLLAGCAVAAVLSRGAGDAAVAGLLLLGSLVAVSGLAGVAWRIEPWALEGQGVWQAATTLTYANAAAAMLVPLVLLGAGRLVLAPESVPTAAAACLLIAGLGATLSRGGALALLVGGCVLARMVSVRALVSAVKGPVAGAAIALASLLPSMVAARPHHPWLAVAGLATGLLVALWSVRPGRVRVPVGAIVAVLMVAGCVLGFSGIAGQALSAARETRLTLGSADRVDEARAALRVGAAHPVTGAGPANASISWTEPDGTVLSADYAHNEYLQTFAELGALGLLLVLALVFSIGRAARRALGSTPGSIPAGAAAGLAALAVHSALDFLWHVPAIPLLAAVLVGLCCFPAGSDGPVAVQKFAGLGVCVARRRGRNAAVAGEATVEGPREGRYP